MHSVNYVLLFDARALLFHSLCERGDRIEQCLCPALECVFTQARKLGVHEMLEIGDARGVETKSLIEHAPPCFIERLCVVLASCADDARNRASSINAIQTTETLFEPHRRPWQVVEKHSTREL